MKKTSSPIVSTVRLGLVALSSMLLTGTAVGQGNAFWHGVVSEDWNESEGNWYDQAPPNGMPVPIPTGTASFCPGAQRTEVEVFRPTSIDSMLFASTVEAYFFDLFGSLTIEEPAGITNHSTATRPTFVLQSTASLVLQNSGIFGPGNGPQIDNKSGGSVQFRGASVAGSSNISNAGPKSRVTFTDVSDGERVLINNSKKAKVFFLKRSNPGSAEITNKTRSLVDLSKTSGAKGNSRITAREIDNSGSLQLGINQLKIDNFAQKRSGVLELDSKKDSIGTINAKIARISGKLVINGKGFRPRRKTVTIVKGSNLFAGRFSKVTLRGFPKGVTASVEYRGNQVALLIRRKE